MDRDLQRPAWPVLLRPLLVLALWPGLSGAVQEAADPFLASLLRASSDERSTLLHNHFQATAVDLPERRQPLSQTLRTLDLGEGRLLLELGINEGAEADLEGGRMGWWPALLAVCRAYGLEPVSVDPPRRFPDGGMARRFYGSRSADDTRRQQVFGGPVQLRTTHRRDPGSILARAVPNGPVLLIFEDVAATEVRRLQGDRQNVDLHYRVRLEPELRQDLVDHALITWRSAIADTGTAIEIRTHGERDILLKTIRDNQEPGGEDQQQRYGYGRQEDQVPLRQKVRLDEVPDGCRAITLAGSLKLTCRTELDLETDLKPDETAPVADAPVPMSLALTASDDAEDAGIYVLILRYRNADLSTVPVVTVTAPDGTLVRSFSRSSTTDEDGEVSIEYHLGNLQPGRHTVRLHCSLDLGDVELPLEGRVVLP